ncbi:hypothetical protein SETIT_5G079800v2 [Setaria italica]|uniref:non-specific serine/threonine protein kinase n=1 Tax=Setaria italica TaxID=4555 RepID=A0A368R2Q8_SETIT|nr:rust resistance kinase Lr10-like [Setaria italica]RCV24374.1 hypothetical protein SETIT_5G079800v2 [Setaria italica]
MNRSILLAVLLCLLNHGADTATAWDDKDFFSYCPPQTCGDGPEIRFPLWFESSNASCRGAVSTKLVCSGNSDTILLHPFLGASKVTAVDYKNAAMKIIPLIGYSACPIQELTEPAHSSACPIEELIDANVFEGGCDLYDYNPARLVDCSREFTPSDVQLSNFFDSGGAADNIAGPIPCLSSNPGRFTYLVHADLPMALLPSDCKLVSTREVHIPNVNMSPSPVTFKEKVEAILGPSEMTITWREGPRESKPTLNCTDCEESGHRCAFSSQRNQTFCMPKGSHVEVIAVTSSVAVCIILSLIVATALYLKLKSKYNKEIYLKVEMFLQTYGTSKPTRYQFSEVKKITRRFKERVGQGGFGSVYKGQLPNGVPVAVKMQENPTGEGEEFMNEVATIGRIHHANVVRLLGFCSEGTRRALIYEFIPNESLGKYIFSCSHNASQGILAPNKMLDIALGVARGMEYLHQGCNQRILHFDIKPHNILLDYSFNPKISDFGLAKLCARDQSIVTLTKARGTMGYIAPEIYSPNFGGISYKSDVYSFGMLVLEMVSGRRNSDPCIENQNEVYFPEWIYDRVINGQNLVVYRELTEEEKEIVRQLAIVALWCIQWNPRNRPSMTKVVNMLTGRFQNLQIPPKPFVSSESNPVQ